MVLVIYGLVSWISFMEMIDDKNVQAKSNDEIFYSSLYIKNLNLHKDSIVHFYSTNRFTS